MNRPPDHLTKEEEKTLSQIIEVTIDDMIAYEKRQDEEEDRANDYD